MTAAVTVAVTAIHSASLILLVYLRFALSKSARVSNKSVCKLGGRAQAVS